MKPIDTKTYWEALEKKICSGEKMWLFLGRWQCKTGMEFIRTSDGTCFSVIDVV